MSKLCQCTTKMNKEKKNAKGTRVYCNLDLFSRFLSALFGDCFLNLDKGFAWWPFAVLLFTKSDKDGIGGRPLSWEEAPCIGEAHEEVCGLALQCSPLLIFVGPWSEEEIIGESALEIMLSVAELVLVPSRFVKSVEFAVDSHLTVLATCE